MNKLLITVFLLCTSFTTNAIAEPYLSDSAKQKYLAWIKEIRQTTHSARFALAIAPNGAWGSHWGYTIAQAKSKALKQCKKYAKSSPCEVVDVDGKSDFINQKTGEPLSYCYNTATNYWYFNNSLATCGSDIKVTKQEYTNRRLKQSGLPKTGNSYELLGSGSFVAQCEKNNQLDVNYSGSRCDLEWDKLGESNRCKIRNSIITFQTYDSAGPAKLNVSTGKLKHGASTYKCILAGDIKVVEKEDTSSSSSTNSSSSSTKVWCAHSGGVAFLIPTTCDAWDGTAYKYEYQAKEANKRGKNWCTTASSVSYIENNQYGACASKGGTSFASKEEAEAEFRRLNKGNSSSSTSSSSTSTGSDYDPTVELEYWKLVRDSNDVDLLQDYLDEYPNGKFAPLARLKIKKLQSSE